MKTFRKGIAGNYLKSSDRLHAKKISNTCKKINNSMRKTVSTLFSSNSITWRKQHALPIERAEATHGKPNLMRLKVAKWVKILLLPPIERAVKVWEKSTHCLLKKLWEQMEKNHNHYLLNKQSKYQEHYHYGNYDFCIDLSTVSQWQYLHKSIQRAVITCCLWKTNSTLYWKGS